MQKAHQQHLFSISSALIQTKFLPYIKIRRGLVKAIVSAFFITIIAVSAVNLAYGFFTGKAAHSQDASEQVAFIPGSFISENIIQGYIKK